MVGTAHLGSSVDAPRDILRSYLDILKRSLVPLLESSAAKAEKQCAVNRGRCIQIRCKRRDSRDILRTWKFDVHGIVSEEMEFWLSLVE